MAAGLTPGAATPWQYAPSNPSTTIHPLIEVVIEMEHRGPVSVEDTSAATDSATSYNGVRKDESTSEAGQSQSRWKAFRASWRSKRVVSFSEKNFIVEKIGEAPDGYAKVASFISSDRNFQTFRGFSTLHMRLILHRQTELYYLEQELEEMDILDGASEEERFKLVTWAAEEDKPRATLLNRIEDKLKAYDELLLRTHALGALGKPSLRNNKSVGRWLNQQNPIGKNQQGYIRYREDLIGLAKEYEDAPIQVFFEGCLKFLPKAIQSWFFSREPENSSSTRNVTFFDQEKIAWPVLVARFILCTGVVVAPIMVLFLSNLNDIERVTIVAAFIILFPGIYMWCTNRRHHEQLFTVVAAYCAVLVVFLGNLRNGSSN